MVQQRQHTVIRTETISTKLVNNQSNKKQEQVNKTSMWVCRCSRGEGGELDVGMLESLWCN